jgi:hypothetical protein
LNNDQYNLTDTNKITIVSTSFKIGANYTVATVSGIGSINTGVFPNPVYPDAGIALSTGSAWASSIPNNSSNWNIAYNDKINNAAFTGTTTKTLTITQLDGGTITAPFTDLQGVTGVTAGTGLTGGTITTTGTVAVDFTTVAPLANPTFTGTVGGITKSMVGLGNVDNTSDANKPISSATQTALNLKFNTADTTSLNLTSRFAAKLNYTDTSFLFTQSDTNQLNLTNRLNLKANINSPTFTGTVGGITKSMVGLGNVDNTSDANKPISSATQTALNLKQNTLNGTGFVKASGTNITYDNSSYLRTGLADSTYLKLTGGELSSNLGVIGNISFGSKSVYSGQYTRYLQSSETSPFRDLFIGSLGTNGDWAGRIHFQTSFATETPTTAMTINHLGNINMNGTLGVTGAATLSSTLAVTGDITENGNNVLTNLDTVSLSNRIDAKYNSSGGTISGAVTLSTTTATPSTLLGKDGSNVVGTVTTVEQTGLFGRGSITNAVTDSNGNITVAHGFNFTPIMAFANLPGQTINIVNVKSVDNNNIVFVVRDGPTNDVLNTISVAKIEFFAIK